MRRGNKPAEMLVVIVALTFGALFAILFLPYVVGWLS